MSVANQVKQYVKQNAIEAATTLFGMPTRKGDRCLWKAPYRTDNNPSLEVRIDGECFDNRDSIGTLIDVWAKTNGHDATSEFVTVAEKMAPLLGIKPLSIAKIAVKISFPTIVKPSPGKLDAWSKAEYGLPWSEFEAAGCTISKQYFGPHGSQWAIEYPTTGDQGNGAKVRSFARLDKNNTKRLVKHKPGGAGFFPADYLNPSATGIKQPLVITAGEEKALALIACGARAVSYSCGEGAIPDRLCKFLIDAGNKEFILAFDGDTAGRDGAAKAAARLREKGATASIANCPDGQDINDLLLSGGVEAVHGLIENATAEPVEVKAEPKFLLQEMKSTDLMKIEFPPIQWLVKDFIPEGVTLIAAPPKIGKSFFCEDVACCIATGRDFMSFKTTMMPTLYLDAEQSARLIQRRMRALGWKDGADNLTFVPMPGVMLDKKKLQELTPQVKGRFQCVVIDTLARLLPGGAGKGDAYQRASEQIGPIHEWATTNGINVLIIHHTKKRESGEHSESHDDITGGRGYAAVVDTLITFKRDEDDMFKCSVTGRIEQGETHMLKLEGVKWKYLGRYGDVAMSNERREIMLQLQQNGELGPSQLAEKLGKSQPGTSKLLRKMREDGLVSQSGKGKWRINPSHKITTNCGQDVAEEKEIGF